MKKFFGAMLLVAFSLGTGQSSFAQDMQLKVSTGSTTGTYARMFREFQGACKNQIMQIEATSNGSVENMDRLLGNEVNAAIVQTDVLFYRARNEDLSGVKTLFALHPEEVHVIGLASLASKEGGFMGIGAKAVPINTINDLTGKKVAAWGGSLITAQVVRLQAELNYQVVEVADYKAAKVLLDKGDVSAIFMVGGTPLADVAALNSNYKLLMFPEATVSKLKSVYVPAKITYSGMGMGGSGVQTIATEALYVTRHYKTPKFVSALGALRACFKTSLPELQETTGTHKKWATVNSDNTGKWAYYELPTTGAPKK